jgi:hypothetical protein
VCGVCVVFGGVVDHMIKDEIIDDGDNDENSVRGKAKASTSSAMLTDETYVRGSIVRVRMVNFVTYDDAESNALAIGACPVF